MVSEVKSVTGRGVPLVGNDVDTDRIIPARFLKCVTFDGLGEHAFADDRAQLNGEHPFDLPQYQGANILVVNGNFGCGSSREHAPQAIAKWGIQAIVGESFAEIFFGNCIALGVPCVMVTTEVAKTLQAQLQADPQSALTVDLEGMQVTCGDFVAPIAMNEGPRQMFVTGQWDATGQLVAQAENTRQVADRLPYIAWQAS
ncbi:MAG: 3-isopropylmalate dehydratase small subunit [Alkalinema sp. CACIAM 70d]|nr:MAG: 3-isopropylmalate dehydratase small subunit [Alkalinema sp. CACIAM 70d]